ncbi:MAG: GTP-binding protein [bacterium]|nr:GTP-binding protein [bacterium]MDA1024498.1 GTP-binding protein [bacterium]
MQHKIPVTILSGFLGSGKTTLLNRLLTEYQDEQLALIVNEFGEIGIDDKLLLRTDEEIIEMNNGAICCVLRDDTTKTLLKLVENKDRQFDRVLIETTGLANPIPIARAILEKPALKDKFKLESVVIMVDASNVLDQLHTTQEAKEQIAAADVIVLNKIDLADERTIAATKMKLRSINPIARIVETQNAEVTLDDLRSEEKDRSFVTDLAPAHHDHDDEVTSFVLEADAALDFNKVTQWIGETIMLNSDKLMRYKGILAIAGKNERFVFQGVHQHFEHRKDRVWKEGEDRKSQVVMIGKDLDEAKMREAFAKLVIDEDKSAS